MSNQNESKQLREFGRRLAEVRKSKGYTQQQLAAKLEISLVSVAYLETGKRWPRLATLHRIADCLGVRLKDFFEGL